MSFEWTACIKGVIKIRVFINFFTKYIERIFAYFLTSLFLNIILVIKPIRCIKFSNLFLKWTSTCFRQFLGPSSGVFHCTGSSGICHTDLLTACEQDQDGCVLMLLAICQQTCMTYTIAACTVENYWWWTEELSEKFRVSFKK